MSIYTTQNKCMKFEVFESVLSDYKTETLPQKANLKEMAAQLNSGQVAYFEGQLRLKVSFDY